MANFLIIEDNEQKQYAIQSLIGSRFVGTVLWARTMLHAYNLLEDQKWDVIILDMTFEDAEGMFRSTSKKPLAGIEILQFIDATGIRTKVIVVTQHDYFPVAGQSSQMNLESLHQLLQDSFPTTYAGLVRARLGDSSMVWMNELTSQIRAILDHEA